MVVGVLLWVGGDWGWGWGGFGEVGGRDSGWSRGERVGELEDGGEVEAPLIELVMEFGVDGGEGEGPGVGWIGYSLA